MRAGGGPSCISAHNELGPPPARGKGFWEAPRNTCWPCQQTLKSQTPMQASITGEKSPERRASTRVCTTSTQPRAKSSNGLFRLKCAFNITPIPRTMPETLDLFPDEPKPEPGSMLEWVAKPHIKLSPAQRAFRDLIAEIETLEKRLIEVTTLLDAHRPAYQKKMRPLLAAFQRLNREMVRYLDAQLSRKSLSARQKKTIQEIICGIAETLFDSEYGAEMETLFDRHSDMTLDELEAMDRAALEADFEDVFGSGSGPGPDTGSGDGHTSDAILQEALRKLQEREAAKAEHAAARAATQGAKQRGGKKSEKALKAEQQAIDAGKMLKDIYRKLTSVLHPDREPDEEERKRKTALMSEVNKAYESGNLLRLLQLQLQAQRIDALTVSTLADEKLRLINHTLRQQQRELLLECRELEEMARREVGLSYGAAVNAETMEKAVKAEAAKRRADLKHMQSDLTWIKTGDAALKAWLKVQRAGIKEQEEMEAFLFDVQMEKQRRRARRGPF